MIINRGEVNKDRVLVLQNPPKDVASVVKKYSISLVCDNCNFDTPSPEVLERHVRTSHGSVSMNSSSTVTKSGVLKAVEALDKVGHLPINQSKVYDKEMHGNINSKVSNDEEPDHANIPEITQNIDTITTGLLNPLKSCCWGDCTSRTENIERWVIWIPFPKPTSNPKRARLWADLCGRRYSEITDNTYICSLHFFRGVHLDHT